MRHSRKSMTDRLARDRALHTHVYISGLAGHHTLETGLAYYYRGHYIYAYPAGTLIEPVPYSTRRGIVIQGIVSESAPVYDAKAVGLVEEGDIRALAASVENERREREVQGDETQVEEDDVVAADEITNSSTSSRTPSPYLAVQPVSPLPTPARLFALRDPSLHTLTPCRGLSFLAASAPGSRLASRSASPSSMRPASSHTAIKHPGSIRGTLRPFWGAVNRELIHR